jgi:hypothetical protein
MPGIKESPGTSLDLAPGLVRDRVEHSGRGKEFVIE